VHYLRRHQALEEVNLQWTAAGDEAVAALAGKPALHRLWSGSRLTDAGVERLRDFPALATPGPSPGLLSVGSASTLTDRTLERIGELHGVADLDLSFWHDGSVIYTARGVASLRRMKSLERPRGLRRWVDARPSRRSGGAPATRSPTRGSPAWEVCHASASSASAAGV
jgi:hypothetical protein